MSGARREAKKDGIRKKKHEENLVQNRQKHHPERTGKRVSGNGTAEKKKPNQVARLIVGAAVDGSAKYEKKR